MRRALRCFIPWLFFTTAGWAQEVVTRFGIVEIARDPEWAEGYILVNGDKPESVKGRFGVFHIEKVIDWGDRGDVILLNEWSGGASCCDSYRMFRVNADGVYLSHQFGDHGYDLSNFEAKPDVITFHMQRDFPADIAYQVASYDGVAGTVVNAMEDDKGIASAGANGDVLRWVGQSASRLLEAPEERAQFRTIIDGEDLNHLRTSLRMGNDLYLSDGFVVGWGFWPRYGESRFGYVGVEVASGKAWAAYEVDDAFFVFGDERKDLPPPMARMIEVNQARVRAFGVSRPD